MTGFDFFAIASRSAMPSAKDVEVRPARGAEVNAATEPAAKKRTASFMAKNNSMQVAKRDLMPTFCRLLNSKDTRDSNRLTQILVTEKCRHQEGFFLSSKTRVSCVRTLLPPPTRHDDTTNHHHDVFAAAFLLFSSLYSSSTFPSVAHFIFV